jgi:hypothetical protein
MKTTTGIRKQLSTHRHPCFRVFSGWVLWGVIGAALCPSVIFVFLVLKHCWWWVTLVILAFTGLHRLLYPIHALLVACKRPLSLCPISGARAATCSVLISRSDLLWLVFVHQKFGLIAAWFGPSNGLNVLAIHLMLYIDLKRDCSENRLSVGFRPLFRLLFYYLSYLLGLTTRRMFRLCGESFNRCRLN